MNAHRAIAAVDPPMLVNSPGGDVERQLRQRIINAGQCANRRAWRTGSGTASSIYTTAGNFAASWAQAPASTEELETAIKALVRLYQAAGLLEQLEAPE